MNPEEKEKIKNKVVPIAEKEGNITYSNAIIISLLLEQNELLKQINEMLFEYVASTNSKLDKLIDTIVQRTWPGVVSFSVKKQSSKEEK